MSVLSRHFTLRLCLLSEGDSGKGRDDEGGGVGVMRVKEGCTGVRGAGFEDGAGGRGVAVALEEVGGRAGLLRHEYDEVKVVGVGVDDWEDGDEDAEEERELDSVDM
jgi:hypothetical protein